MTATVLPFQRPGDGWRPDDTFGSRLAAIRHRLKISQEVLAEMTGLKASTIATWEDPELGRKPRKMDDVVRSIVDATGCDRDWLMWGASSGTNPPGDQEQGPTGRSSVSPGQGNARVLQLVA